MTKVSFRRKRFLLSFLGVKSHHPLSYSECGQLSVFRSCLLSLLEKSQAPSCFLLTVPVLKLRHNTGKQAKKLLVFLSLREWKKKEGICLTSWLTIKKDGRDEGESWNCVWNFSQSSGIPSILHHILLIYRVPVIPLISEKSRNLCFLAKFMNLLYFQCYHFCMCHPDP